MKVLKIAFLVIILMMSGHCFSQESQKVVLDGTQGEMLEDVKRDTVPNQQRDKRWRLFPGRLTSLKIGAGFLVDYVSYLPNEVSKMQMDSAGNVLESAFEVRDLRLVVSGKLTTRRNITWKAGFMYNGDTREWMVRETGVMVGVPEWWGNIFVGRTKEGFSLSKVMNGYAGWTMERQMALDVIPILADGVKWMGYLPKQRIFWNVGVFTDWLSEQQSFSTFNWQTATRVGWLPMYSSDDNNVFHVGFSYRYGEPNNGEIRVSSRPEANPTPKFIDTGKFQSDYSNQFGAEAYYKKGPWMFGSEVYSHRFSSSTSGDPVFFGGDVVVSYMITGESRPYYTATAIFGFVPVKRTVFKGGPGAWEILFRASALDLNGGTLQGGKFWRITPMVNWYLSKDVRLELAYGYGVLDRFNLKGATQFFQSRLQLTLL